VGIERPQLIAIEHSITGRQALQRYGTEGHRDVFGEDFWVDALLPVDSYTEGTVGPQTVGMEPTGKTMARGAGRPAELYQFTSRAPMVL